MSRAGLWCVLMLALCQTGCVAAGGGGSRLPENVDALAIGVRQQEAGWRLEAGTMTIQRRQVWVLAVAGHDEVLLRHCRIETDGARQAFTPLAEHFAPMPIKLQDVEVVSGGRAVRYAEVDVGGGRPTRFVP